MSSGRTGRIGAGLFDAEKRWPDAQKFMPDAEYVKKGAEFSSLTGVALTHLGNGDIFYAVDTTSAAVTVTLPAVDGTVGQHHIVKRISGGSNACNIVAEEGTAILDGSATHSIAAQYGIRSYFSDGMAWRGEAGAGAGNGSAWLQATPAPNAFSGTFTAATATVRYTIEGKKAFFNLNVVITTAGTAANAIFLTMPFTAAARQGWAGRNSFGSTDGAGMDAGSNTLFINAADGTTSIASGKTLSISGTAEIQ